MVVVTSILGLFIPIVLLTKSLNYDSVNVDFDIISDLNIAGIP